MVRAASIQFDIETAKTRATTVFANGKPGELDLRKWAARADVSTVTLRAWLRGDSGIKLKTIEKILRPIGLTTAELIIKKTA